MNYILYNQLAEWYPLLTSVDDYLEEATLYHGIFKDHGLPDSTSVLELGSGAGHNAYHLKKWYRLTLTDLSEKMLALSRRINPECRHVTGDMRTIRLQSEFDAVFIHDAIMYMLTESDLRQAIATAFQHCLPGGLILVAPDFVGEIFSPSTSHGGEDHNGRSMRYLEWITGPTEHQTCYSDFIYAMRDGTGPLNVITERHEWGLFPTAVWMQLFQDHGAEATSFKDPYGRILFLAVKK